MHIWKSNACSQKLDVEETEFFFVGICTASRVAVSRYLATPTPGHGFGSDLAVLGNPGVSDVGSVDTEPCGVWRIPGLARRAHGRRVSDFVCATLTEVKYSFTTTVFFFDHWGRDEDPRWFGGEHSPGVGGRHKTTAPVTLDHRVPAASAATALPLRSHVQRHRQSRKSHQPVVLGSARGTECAT